MLIQVAVLELDAYAADHKHVRSKSAASKAYWDPIRHRFDEASFKGIKRHSSGSLDMVHFFLFDYHFRWGSTVLQDALADPAWTLDPSVRELLQEVGKTSLSVCKKVEDRVPGRASFEVLYPANGGVVDVIQLANGESLVVGQVTSMRLLTIWGHAFSLESVMDLPEEQAHRLAGHLATLEPSVAHAWTSPLMYGLWLAHQAGFGESFVDEILVPRQRDRPRNKPRCMDLTPCLTKSQGLFIRLKPSSRTAVFYEGRLVMHMSAALAAGQTGVVALMLRCRRRPKGMSCPGRLQAEIFGPNCSEGHADFVRWSCPICGDCGEVSNWRGTAFDATAEFDGESKPEHTLRVSDTDLRKLQKNALLGPLALRVLLRAKPEGFKYVSWTLEGAPAAWRQLAYGVIGGYPRKEAENITNSYFVMHMQLCMQASVNLGLDDARIGAERLIHIGQNPHSPATLLGRAPRIPAGLEPGTTTEVLRLRITLRNVQPRVWRELTIGPSRTLSDLHAAIQLAMGWTDSHLYCFNTSSGRFGDPIFERAEDLNDARCELLSAFLQAPGDTLDYEYDFGDCWHHDIELLAKSHGEPELLLPAGERSCPPEDAGGPAGYADKLAIREQPFHKRHHEILAWLGDEFDPDVLSTERHKERLSRLAKSWSLRDELAGQGAS